MDNATEKEFIQKFAIELTNRNIFEREQIGKKYYKLWKNAQDTYDMYKALMESFEISNSERLKYQKTLEEIREIINTLIIEMPEYHDCYYKDECGDNCTPKQQGKVAYCCFENVEKIEKLINEVLKDV